MNGPAYLGIITCIEPKKQICRFEEKKLFGKKGTKHQAVPLKHKTCSTFLRTSSVLLALSFCQRSLNESYHHQNDFRGAPARRCHIPNRFGYSQTAEGVVAVCCNERLHESRATDQTWNSKEQAREERTCTKKRSKKGSSNSKKEERM